MELLRNLIWLIPIYPLLAFVAIVVLGLNRNKKASSGLAIAAMALATLHSWGIVFETVGSHEIQVEGWRLAVPWLATGSGIFNMGFAVDGFTAAMLFMVPFVCLLIFIYASEYMEGYDDAHGYDPHHGHFGRYSRFFAYVSLFASGMLWLVIADNLLLLFMAWEIMGLCSYLLIGFWFEKTYPDADQVATPSNPIQGLFLFWKYNGPEKIPPKSAALKAFLTTRVGDTLLFAGMLILWSYAGTLTFRELFEPAMLENLTEMTLWGVPIATLSALLIFGGVVGKSAQFPLHVWLPDAMEGPTPVSALIHAATMVSAGVYLLARMLPLFATIEGGATMQWVAIIGAITAVMGATIGLAQFDVKRVLAYSTISQLGYMVMALGLGGFLAGVFHLLTHAFFKALLFMGSGSIIHAMEHGAHHVHDHHTDPQDMRNMGGLRHKMKASFWAYMFGTLALVGVFPFAGFWSKDEILAEAFLHGFGDHPNPVAFWAFVAGAVAAVFTAFYMGRQVGLVFYGKPRTALAEHAVEPGPRMTWPLLILAVFALFIGFINIPTDVPVIGHGWFHSFAGEVHEIAHEAAPGIEFEAVPFNFELAAISTVAGFLIFALGVWRYSRVHSAEAADPVQLIPLIGRPVFALLNNKYYFDEIYRGVLIYPTLWLANFSAKFDYDWVINRIVNFVGDFTRVVADGTALYDQGAIDGLLVNGIPGAFRWIGGQLRFLQTGRVQNYLLVLVVGVLILVGLYLALWSGQSVGLAVVP
jgi:NADH-quinone oxidoreductase subunit L